MNDVIPMADANGVGPLEVIERDIGGLEYFIVPAGGMISDDLASGIIDRDDYTPEQMRAWARLFAAAPDLLEALKLLYREMELSGNLGSKQYGWPEATTKAQAAIAKAEGK